MSDLEKRNRLYKRIVDILMQHLTNTQMLQFQEWLDNDTRSEFLLDFLTPEVAKLFPDKFSEQP